MAEKKEGKGGLFKTIVLVILILIFLPAGILSGFYFLNPTFQEETNKILSGAPGPVGQYFQKFPTSQEKNRQLRSMASYYLGIDQSRAVDKLALLSSQDKAVYDEVVKHMLRMNPNTTKKILEDIRKGSLKKDIILDTLDKIEEEKNEDIKEKAEYLTKLSLQTAVEEMGVIMNSSVNGHKTLAAYMSAIDINQAAKLMGQLATPDYNKVLSFIPDEKAREIRTTIAGQKKRKTDLENIAFIYSSKDNEQLVNIMGNKGTYTVEELAKLYVELGPIKAGQVLAKVGNDEFTFEIIDEMRDQEIIEKGTDKITADILKSLKIYKEFDDNVTEMTKVYSKMDGRKVASVIRRMVRNSSSPRLYELENGQTIIISDEDIALSLMSRFDSKRVGELMSYLDDTLASEISRKLTLPKNE